MSWLPLFTEGDVGNAEVEIVGLIEPPLRIPVRVQSTVPCVWWRDRQPQGFHLESQQSVLTHLQQQISSILWDTIFISIKSSERVHHKFWVGQPSIIFPGCFLFWNLTRLVFCLKCKTAYLSRSSHVLVCSFLLQVFRALILGSVVLLLLWILFTYLLIWSYGRFWKIPG